MKAATRQSLKTLDYFTSTIIPYQALRAVAVLTLKHGFLLLGLCAGMMALVRQILAN
jgi:hypothetical protein